MPMSPKTKNAVVASVCAMTVGGMVGLSFAAVPLYNLFCRVTGYGGETVVSQSAPETTADRSVTVRFDASLARGLPWEFKPVDPSQTVKLGEQAITHYRATNLSDRPIVGQATYNVTPQKVGGYFAKIDCFCFSEQLLAPGESVLMPVLYYVDPEMVDEHSLDEIKTITLSYTFFEKEHPTMDVEKTLALRAGES